MTTTKPSLPPDHADRMARVRLALDGLSVGDAFGEQFFREPTRLHLLDDEPYTPPGRWHYTDDTEMALGIADVLARRGSVDQHDLAETFARRFQLDPSRGYGPGAIRFLNAVCTGADWQVAGRALFSGMGSFGNGSAMRVAPVGAYFADDGFEAVAEQARLSSKVTHRHPEGVAGGVAIAIAAAYAWRNRTFADVGEVRRGLFDVVLAHTPASEVRTSVERAAGFEPELSVRTAASFLGNGSRVTCQDTVPFCLWVIARHLSDYTAAIWNTVTAGGDIDTTAAIVGGVVGLAVGEAGLPAEWLSRREDLASTF